MQEALTEIDKERDKRVEACIDMGNKAVQSAIIDQLTPKHEKFEFAVKVLDTQIGRLLGDELALNHNQLIENSEYRQQAEELYTNLSFLRFARGITKSTNKRRKEIRDDLSRGIEKGDSDWYNNPKNSTSIYYSLLTSDKNLRGDEEGCFTGLKGSTYQTIAVPLLYLGKEFAEYDEEERYTKAEEMIVRKLAEFTE